MPVSAESDVVLGTYIVTEDSVRRYLESVGDGQRAYFEYRAAPPLALSAWALGYLLEELSLPPGAIHSRQELETYRAAEFGETIACSAHLGRTRELGNMKLLNAEYTLKDSVGRLVQSGKSTVLVPGPSDGDSGEKKRQDATQQGEDSAEDSAPVLSTNSTTEESPAEEVLPVVSKTITQDQLTSYARASGDYNPLHLDPTFADATQFGGIIAHGMLTLGFIGEMMAAAFGWAWLETGTLKARLKGAAYLGDHLETWGRITKEEPVTLGRLMICSVGVRNVGSGQVLIQADATAKTAAS